MSEPTRQFVVLQHEASGAVHWDLMLDMGGLLATWRFSENPCSSGSADVKFPLRITRIKDHRRIYLDYEGPISGGRGRVTRVDGGQYTLLKESTGRWTVRLAGALLSGTYQLTEVAGADAVWEWCPLDG